MGIRQGLVYYYFFIKNFFGGTVRGELSVSCAHPTFLYRGGRVAPRPDPIKSFKINRVPVNANNCSGLASRIKKPAASAGVSDWRVSRGLCHAVKAGGATRRVYLWARQLISEFQFYMLNCKLRPTTCRCAFWLAI